MASETEPVSILEITENMQLSHLELLDVMQSLGRRSLIEKTKQGNETLFILQPVVNCYVKTHYPRS
ncbi:hypothetical protein [Coleofasciculus sp. H7-2]|uniref:hypothetical protein n=1 Tax=Coleofasciculus sp. H7-2 TaxID=3351545 RepID=UPI0036718F3D